MVNSKNNRSLYIFNQGFRNLFNIFVKINEFESLGIKLNPNLNNKFKNKKIIN